ncbi:MAG TPA: ABC transporter permease [Vicinamibacterales bacterium]|nr:ABC transporter permease [Vicinamibacterales bacterium]
MTPHPAPPRGALRLLASLPAIDRDSVIGDLTEEFADRVDARRRFARVWFWANAVVFMAAAIGARAAAAGPLPTWRQLMGRFGRGLRHAARRLRHEWRYSLAVIFILAIGIGPAAAMIAVFERVLLRPLDYYEPERLGLVRIDIGNLRAHPGLSPAEAIDLRNAGVFEAVEVETRLVEASLGTGPEFTSLSQLSMTTGMLPMLGVQPILGRNLAESDFVPFTPPPPPAPGAPPAPPPPPPPQAALIDYGLWQRQFGGAPDVLGRAVQVNGRQTVIVGVLPEHFRLVTGRAVPQPIDIYTPLRLTDFRNAWQFPTLVRIKRGTTFAEAQAGLDLIGARNKESFPQFYEERVRYLVSPVLDDMTRTTKPALRAAVGAVVLLLVIAFANASALVVARLRSREQDIAIRSAIGATRSTLVIEVFVESLVLGAGAAVLGGLFALAAIAGVREVIPRTVPRWDEINVGWDLIVYTAGLALGGLLFSGLIPVWRISRGETWNALRSGSAQGGRSEGTASRLVLVGAQIALTVVLAFGCVQLVRSAARLRQVDLGFEPNVMTFRVPFDFRRFPNPGARAQLYQRIRDRVRQVPGVTSVGVVTHIPLSGSTMMDGYETDLSKEPSFEPYANYQAVTPGYFETLRIPIVQGRDFTDQEDAQSQPVIVVDETLARSAFPGVENVIGRELRLGWGLRNSRIVGVVGHARTVEVGRVVRPQIYAPIGNLFQNAGIVTVRTSGEPQALAPAIAAAINEVGPGRAIAEQKMLSANVEAATSALVAVTGLVSFLAISAGLLSAIGLYLVIAYVVHQRRRATAIRTALGASRRQVMWQHFKTSGLVMTGAVPIGLLLSVAVAPLFADLVYGLDQRDVSSLAIAVVIATAAGIVGTWVPVRRSANANVVKVLRE